MSQEIVSNDNSITEFIVTINLESQNGALEDNFSRVTLKNNKYLPSVTRAFRFCVLISKYSWISFSFCPDFSNAQCHFGDFELKLNENKFIFFSLNVQIIVRVYIILSMVSSPRGLVGSTDNYNFWGSFHP